MSTLTLTVSDETLAKLKQLAKQLGVAPEALLQASLLDLLAPASPAYQQAAEYVLRKNAELYQRLA